MVQFKLDSTDLKLDLFPIHTFKTVRHHELETASKILYGLGKQQFDVMHGAVCDQDHINECTNKNHCCDETELKLALQSFA